MCLNAADYRSKFVRHSRGYHHKSGRKIVQYLEVNLPVSINQQIFKVFYGTSASTL